MMQSMMSQDAETARRIAFILARAENDFGLRVDDNRLPFAGRVAEVLQAAMGEPSKITAEVYQLLHDAAFKDAASNA